MSSVITVALLLIILPFSLFAVVQTSTSLSLSSGTGGPGNVVNLTLSMSAINNQPASLGWTLTYSTKDFSQVTLSPGASATAAGKSISCTSPVAGTLKCLAYGLNANAMSNGVVANVAMTVSNSTTSASSTVQLTAGTTATVTGSNVGTSTAGSIVTIQNSGPTITGISCTPDAVIPPAPSTCLVTLSVAAPSGGTSVSTSGDSLNVIVPPTLTINAGSSSGSFQVATSSLMTASVAHITATLGSSSAMFPLSLVAPTPTGVSVDATATQNSSAAGTTIVSPSFSTNYANEVLLAFVSGGPGSGLTVTSVTGANLSWVLVQRTNTQSGTAEIWRAFAPTMLIGATVSATFSSSVYSSLTVMSFAGADPSGANGSGAIGATVSASAAAGAPAATLTTTRDFSLVVAVGTDPTNATVRLPGSSQNIVAQDLSPNKNTYWVQTEINPTPISGTAVTISDSSPNGDAYNLTAVEILPPSYCLGALVPANRSFPVGGGSTSLQVATGPGCSWTATTNSPTLVTFNGGSGTGNGSFTATVAANLTGQAQLATISAAGATLEVMEAGSVPIFGDVPLGSQFFDYISLMYSNGITAGCSASPLIYCPATDVTRAEMAVFMVSAIEHINHSIGQLPPTYSTTPYFQDVPSTNQFFPFVQRLADLGITNGCQASPPMFCPNASINQGQMAKFVILAWLAYNNATKFTYTLTPYFSDVPSTDTFFSYIQKMMDLGFWTGCGGGMYCETNTVSRAQMAPMIMRVLGAP
jgi:hypothetical protein